ncbi:AAA family ATPase [Streptomyces sp. NPDC048409]|uniref:AAA family ATPase n=1 Tax=Streptomyces sp. NPDC048409 TaxID=3154723 RepID=UPI00342BBE0F
MVTLTPFTVISGLHGAGKSTLLKCISESLMTGMWSREHPPFLGVHSPATLGGQVEVSGSKGGAAFSYTVDLSVKSEWRDRGSSKVGIFPDVHNLFEVPSEIAMFFQDAPTDGKVIEKQEGAEWVQSRKDLDALRDILGVTYDEVVYYPVKVDYLSPIFPYVRARQGDRRVDSYSMSYGELSVHRMRWFVRHPYDDSIVLLDEPEANIAPRGHAALVDDLARLARAARVQVLAVTHSPVFLTRVPLEFVRVCVRTSHGPMVMQPSKTSDLRDALGVENPLRSIILVEDEAALELLKLVLAAHSFASSGEVEIIDVGSWNDVLSMKVGLSKSQRLRAVAVVDGDQRNNPKLNDASRNVLFLPGAEPPERVLIRYAIQYPEELAKLLGCSLASVNVYLSELDGLDHHRWLETLSLRTGNDWRYCLRAAFSIWHEESKNRALTEKLVRDIECEIR